MIGDWSLILQDRVTSRSKIIIKYKEKEQRGRFGEIDEKISREEYTLDWSQSKVFLVLNKEGKISSYITGNWTLQSFSTEEPNKKCVSKLTSSSECWNSNHFVTTKVVALINISTNGITINRDHSFPEQIFPDSADQFAKFCSYSQQIFRT